LKRVVQFSGGLCSYLAAKRVLQKYGPADVTLLFADTLIESPGLYRFLNEASAKLGVPVTRIADGRTPWQVFRDERFLGNSQVDPCSRILKRDLCRDWMDYHCCMEPTIVYVGISWDEGRIDEIRARWQPYAVEAPMCEAPLLTKCQMMEEAAADGLTLSESYRDGFPHDNCGGKCVKAGQAQWASLYKIRPASYAEAESEEAQTIAALGKDVSILKDRRGGETKPMTLAAFRERIETGDYDKDEWGGCGCGV
jgi:hypothetical protein